MQSKGEDVAAMVIVIDVVDYCYYCYYGKKKWRIADNVASWRRIPWMLKLKLGQKQEQEQEQGQEQGQWRTTFF